MVLRISYMHHLMKLTIKFIGNVICYLSVICDVYQKPNKYTRMCVQISLHFGRVLDAQSMNKRRRAIYVCVFRSQFMRSIHNCLKSFQYLCPCNNQFIECSLLDGGFLTRITSIYLPCSFVDYYIPDFIAVFVVVLAHIRPSDGLGPPFCVLSVYLTAL